MPLRRLAIRAAIIARWLRLDAVCTDCVDDEHDRIVPEPWKTRVGKRDPA
jgi:hypothetical protein